MPSPRHLLSDFDLSPKEGADLIARARAIKAGRAEPELRGRVAALLFFQPSVRTRLSLESAMARFGGAAVAMTPGSDTWKFAHEPGVVMDGESQEHVKELGPVLSRLAHAIAVRRAERIGGGGAGSAYDELKEDHFLRRLAAAATVPVLNLESNRFHPLQGLADRMTIQERLGDPRGKRYVLTWAMHPRALPAATPHSQMIAACDLGMHVTILRPRGYDLDPEVLTTARERAVSLGGSLATTEDATQALKGAKVVCAKSWGRLDCYADPERETEAKRALADHWTFDRKKLALTDRAFFMHCLPVRRNVVVADEVLDSPASAVIDEAENRLWTAAAVLEWALGSTPQRSS